MFLPHSDSFSDESIGNPETETTHHTNAKQIIKFITGLEINLNIYFLILFVSILTYHNN